MKRIVALTAVLSLVLVGLSFAGARKGNRKEVILVGPGQQGTVTYDPGPPQDFFRSFDGTNRSIGNQFNTRNGNPLIPGPLSFVTAFPIAVGGDIIVTIWGAPVGTQAPVIVTASGGGAVNSTFNAVPVSPSVGSSFLAGQYIGTFGSGPDQVGMRSGSINGQGFHAMQINFVGGTAGGTGFQTLPGLNAMVRASGVIVPVELMSFDIE